MKRIYLDHQAWTPVDSRVLASMDPWLRGLSGNPSAAHAEGKAAFVALEEARTQVARLLGGDPSGVIFTSGATEANNLAILGVGGRHSGRHAIVSAVEHISVLNPCRALEKAGYRVSLLPVDSTGRIDPQDVARAITRETSLVSIQAANPEVGTLQPIREVARLGREYGVPFHVDGVGAVGRIPLDITADRIDLLTLSSNDLNGPPGAGALYVRPGVAILPHLLGGGQEGGYRSGTENAAALVGFGLAAELMRSEGPAEVARLASLRDRLMAGLLAFLGVHLTGARDLRLPQHVSVSVEAVKGESLVMGLDLEGVAASTGSACASKTQEPSHVLRALGLRAEEIEGSLVFTLGRGTTEADIDGCLAILGPLMARLRDLSPLSVR